MSDKLWEFRCGDCLEIMPTLPADSCSLVLGSPPYMDARTYGIDAVRDCQEWVDWMLDVTEAAIRVSTGLVLWVVAGVQRDLCYWPGCEGLAWEWWKRGHHLWRPCIWWKVDENECGSGIPGSGGKQWLRNQWEYVLAFKRKGWLPWADPLVFGHEPVIPHLGGEMSNRTADGQRINDRVGGRERRQDEWADDPWQKRGRGNNLGGRKKDGTKNLGTYATGEQIRRANGTSRKRMDVAAGHDADGNLSENGSRPMPKIANPGNCIIVKARVGGGHMGNRMCSLNEAPYPEDLCEFFIRSFCPPGGLVLDPYSGSGTTVAVAVKCGRRGLGIDIRESQVQLGTRRLEGVTPEFAEMA